VSLVMTAKKLLFAALATSQQKQVSHVRSDVDDLVINRIVCAQPDVEEFALVVSSDIDTGILASPDVIDNRSELYACSNLLEFLGQ
jgi:hypothetical protein